MEQLEELQEHGASLPLSEYVGDHRRPLGVRDGHAAAEHVVLEELSGAQDVLGVLERESQSKLTSIHQSAQRWW